VLTSPTVRAIARPGETIPSSSFHTAPGGKGANQAVAVAKAGGSVDFVGAVGPGGQWLVDVLISHRVGVSRIAQVQVCCELYKREPAEVIFPGADRESLDTSCGRWGELDR